MPASRRVRLKGSGEEEGAAGGKPAAVFHIPPREGAGMGKIGRSYPRFDETLVDEREQPSVTALEVIIGLSAVLLALGLVGLLLAFPPS